MMICPACKDTGYKKKKFTEDAKELCGIKNTKLSYFLLNCGACGHSAIDVKSLEKSRKDLLRYVVSCELSVINRQTINFLFQQLFEDSLFVMATATGLHPSFLRDVMKSARPLTEDVSNKILEASFVKLNLKRNITFKID